MAFIIWSALKNPADKKSKKQTIKDEEKNCKATIVKFLSKL